MFPALKILVNELGSYIYVDLKPSLYFNVSANYLMKKRIILG